MWWYQIIQLESQRIAEVPSVTSTRALNPACSAFHQLVTYFRLSHPQEIILIRITRVLGKNSSLSSARPPSLLYNAHRNLIPVQYHRIRPITMMLRQKASGVCWRLSLEMRYQEAKSLISPRSVGCSPNTSFASPDWLFIIRLYPPIHNCRHQCTPWTQRMQARSSYHQRF